MAVDRNGRQSSERNCGLLPNILLPTHGLITNCGKAHLEGFGSEEGVKKAKVNCLIICGHTMALLLLCGIMIICRK